MKTNMNNSESGLKSRSEQLSTNKLPRISFKRRFANRALRTQNLLALLHRDAPRLFELAEVVGKWVWIQFDSKQPSEITRELAELGFHWNNRRQSWQHPCGTIPNIRANFDPRERYGSYFPTDHQHA